MGISIWQLLIILAIVLVLFGAKRLRTIGTDLGSAVKGFRSAMREGEQEEEGSEESKRAAGHLEGGSKDASDDHTFEGETTRQEESERR